MLSTAAEASDDEDYILLREPYSRSGYAVKWQCEMTRSSSLSEATNRWWVDYSANYNIVLEAAFQNKQAEALLVGGDVSPGGDWLCNLETFVQTNTTTSATRLMRRSVVTRQG
jgi:hypothetical protein